MKRLAELKGIQVCVECFVNI